MYKKQTFSSAFRHALNGVWYFFLNERNGKVQCAAAITAIGCGWLFKINSAQWICILLCIGAVLSLEMMNSALEKLCDVVQENYHPAIKIVKDVAAGAVLLASVMSVIIGCFIYLPKLILLCSGV